MPILIYQRTRDGNPVHGWDQWVSFGGRPEVFLTKYLWLAFEGGFDHTHSSPGQFDGWLRKFTIAPQIGAGRQFFSRPTLRDPEHYQYDLNLRDVAEVWRRGSVIASWLFLYRRCRLQSASLTPKSVVSADVTFTVWFRSVQCIEQDVQVADHGHKECV